MNESGWIEKTARSLFVDEILPGKIYARGRNGVKLAHSSFKVSIFPFFLFPTKRYSSKYVLEPSSHEYKNKMLPKKSRPSWQASHLQVNVGETVHVLSVNVRTKIAEVA